MKDKPDLMLEYRGVKMEVFLSAYESTRFSKEDQEKPPTYSFTARLYFPRQDWDEFIEANFPYRHGEGYGYKNHLEVRVRTKGYDTPLPESGPPPTSKWEVELEAYRYVTCGGGFVCNKTAPKTLKFKDKNGSSRLRAAVIQLLRDNPDALKKVVAENHDIQVAAQEEAVARAKLTLQHEKDRLAELKEKSRRQRPRVNTGRDK